MRTLGAERTVRLALVVGVAALLMYLVVVPLLAGLGEPWGYLFTLLIVVVLGGFVVASVRRSRHG